MTRRTDTTCLHLGMVLGLITDENVQTDLVRAITDDDLNADYIQALRDTLTTILQKANVEATQ